LIPHPDDPRAALGEPLWEALGAVPDPALPAGFDGRFRAALRRPWYRRRPLQVGAGLAVLAAAAGAALLVRPPAPPPPDDLALVAELDLVENLALVQELDVLMAWDGQAP